MIQWARTLQQAPAIDLVDKTARLRCGSRGFATRAGIGLLRRSSNHLHDAQRPAGHRRARARPDPCLAKIRAHSHSPPMRAIAANRTPRLLPTKMPTTNHTPPVPRKVYCAVVCQSMMDFMIGKDNRHPPSLGGYKPARWQPLGNQERCASKHEKRFRTGIRIDKRDLAAN